MSSALLEIAPREASPVSLDDLDPTLFEAFAAPEACVSTCVSGFTIKCDGKTYNRTCVTGWTLRCDG